MRSKVGVGCVRPRQSDRAAALAAAWAPARRRSHVVTEPPEYAPPAPARRWIAPEMSTFMCDLPLLP
jgi:hypothetical protein